MNKKLLLLLIISAILRAIFAAFTELGNDEVYYRIFALFPDWSYFDHPPLVAWIIRLTTFGAIDSPELLVRLGSIIIGTLNTYIIYDIARKLTKSERGGLIAALLYCGSIYSTAIVGIFIMPDTPMSLFWLLTLRIFIEILPKSDDKISHSKMLLAGLFIGLTMLSKYSGLYLWGAAGLYIMIFNRKWLTKWSLWVAITITLLTFMPVIIWNWQNDFISFTFHSGRVGSEDGIKWFLVGREVIGGFLYNGFINVVAVICAVVIWLKGRKYVSGEIFWFCIIFSMPMIILFLGMSFRSETLPHWASPAYFALFILTAAYLNSLKKHQMTAAIWSASIVGIAAIIGVIIINSLPAQIGSQEAYLRGRNDPTLDMYGWTQGGEKFDSLVKNDTIQMPANTVLLQYGWDEAAHIDAYFAMPYGYTLKTLGALNSVHYYKWITDLRGGFKQGDSAYLITSSNYPPNFNLEDAYKAKFNTMMPADTLRIERAGRHVKSFFVYRLLGYKGESAD